MNNYQNYQSYDNYSEDVLCDQCGVVKELEEDDYCPWGWCYECYNQWRE